MKEKDHKLGHASFTKMKGFSTTDIESAAEICSTICSYVK